VGIASAGALAALAACSHIVVLHDPLSAAEHNDLGVAYEARRQLDLAEREYRRAVRRDARFAVAKVNLGNLAAARGRWAEAERWYRTALRDRADDPDAMNNLAVALTRRGRRLDEAEALAERALASGARDSLYRATLDEVRRARRERAAP
jgi:Tfp pilus assembly protein PilF